jgi:TonB-linked SusC/RagA family outer membrane protein
MEKKLMLMLSCLFLMVGTALAQTKISGSVLSEEDGEPVIGATVQVIGSQVGAPTDANGKFELTVPAGKKMLRVSYVGMETKEVAARNGIRVLLKSNSKSLDEVIVVAYGTAKKSAFTGSAAVMKAEDMEKVQVTNPVEALTGKVSGVQINTATGQPGAGTTNIRIRGISSINAGNAPLIIVDGAPYDGDLNTINSQDVESMTVLKDAASAALYGARGANGVILITTKSGKKGEATITVDAKWGQNSRAIPDYKYVTSAAKYYEMYYGALNSYATNALKYNTQDAYNFAVSHLTDNSDYGLGYNVYTVPNGQNLIGTNGKLNPNATLGRKYTYNGQEFYLTPDDWTDETYNNSLRQEYNVSASASNDRGSFFASVNYLNNKGLVVASGYKRLSSRLKADYQLKDWLKVAGNFSYAHHDMDYFRTDEDGSTGSSGNAFALTTVAPIYPMYVRDGNGNIMYDSNAKLNIYDYGDGAVNGMYRPYIQQANPVSAYQLDTHNGEGNTFSATGSAEIRFLKDFKFTSTNSVNVDETRYTLTTNPYYGQYASSKGEVTIEHDRNYGYNLQQLLTWRHTYGLNNIDLMLGHEYYKFKSYTLYGSKSNQFSTDNTELNGAIKNGDVGSYNRVYNVEGFFGRAQYDYDGKYFGSFSFRRDGSSYFDPDHRWGNFYSFGGAWLINKEKFFHADWVDELKFKASYGEQGNDQIGNSTRGYDLYTTTYNITNSNGNVSIVAKTLGNKNISWEKSGNFNMGFDFSLFKNRLSGSIEYFARKTTDMLFYFPVAVSYGYTGYYDNVGDMTNKGIEVELNGTIIDTRDLQWEGHLNLTSYRNRVTKLADANKTTTVDGKTGFVTSIGDNPYFIAEKTAMYTFYMPKYAGVNKETGESMWYKDVTDDKGNVTGEETTTKYSDATKHLCGSALPDVYGGFGTSVKYKGFDASIDFTYQIGGKVYDQSYAASMASPTTNSKGRTFNVDLLNAWTPTNTDTDIPRLQFGDTYSASMSDRFLTNASYLSLQNFTVGYSLPKSVISKMYLTKVRFYVSGENVWTWSKRQGLDPRQSVNGNNSGAYYSPIRTISGGITVSF